MEVAHGHVTDRPFARTFYTVAARHFTGDMILEEGGRRYKVSWEDGQVVAAESAAPADSAARLALSAGLLTTTHVQRSLELMAAEPGREPLEVIRALARLSDEQITRLKRRLVAHRAARLFALPAASFVLDNARSLRADPDVPALDGRWVIYHGIRTHYTVDRLEAETAAVAEQPLTLAADAVAVLPAFGFADAERGVIERLRHRAWTIRQLMDASPELEPRLVRSIVYALVACDCLEAGQLVESPAPPNPAPRPAGRPAPTATTERATPSASPASAPATALPTARSALAEGTRRFTDPPRARPLSAPPPPGTAASEIHQLIGEKLRELDAGVNHFAVLGVDKSADTDAVRAAYFALAKRLHPDRLKAVGIADSTGDAQKLFARINLAFAVLTDPAKRQEYGRVLSAGGEAAVKKSQIDADVMASRILKAEETYHRGEMALRRNQFEAALDLFAEAVELNPEEAEYQALLAWATWLSAADKIQVSAAVQKRLGDAIGLSPRCVPAHFYRGQVAKQIGRIPAAIESFKKVLELKPDHAEASLELRVLLGREKKDDSIRGLFGKKPPR